MNLPVYKYHKFTTFSKEELEQVIFEDFNLRSPAVIDILEMTVEDQKEFVTYVENYFTKRNESFLFPYPIYFLSQINSFQTKIPILKEKKYLPRFFNKKESRMNVKESGLADKNKLIQLEIKNSDPNFYQQEIKNFGETHRTIYQQEKERIFYRKLISTLFKGHQNG